MMLPPIFKGIKILDFSRLLPGPFASTLLQRMGAEVTCVLPPQGDPLLGAYSPFKTLEQGKSFITLDLKTEADSLKVKQMISESQILLEGFRPGAMGRLGIGFEAARVLRPDLLYVSIVGYSKSHPHYLKGSHDLNFLVDSGVYSLLFPDDSQLIPSLQLADVLGGFYAAFCVLAEWIQRFTKPEARHLEVSVVEGLRVLAEYLRGAGTLPLLGWLTGGLARYHIYFTRDQKRIAVCAIEPKFFENLQRALGLELSFEDGPEKMAELQKVFSQKNLEEWKRQLADADACLSFIPSRMEALLGDAGA